jgi:uncharacterized protein
MSFEQLKTNPVYMAIVQTILSKIKKLPNALKRAKFVHKTIDEYVEEVFADSLVKKLSPCKVGCSACCHTQVSVTHDEAELLVRKINGGISINLDQLDKQALVSSEDYIQKLSYEERACIFLDNEGACKVYADRPSVCRTNAVIGTNEQCDTRSGTKETRLVLTKKADMVVYASFYISEDSGTLPELVKKIMVKQRSGVSA